jgi:hypothetical protein
MTVKEPTGTGCSIEQRQTPGGGNLVSADAVDRATPPFIRLCYTCTHSPYNEPGLWVAAEREAVPRGQVGNRGSH